MGQDGPKMASGCPEMAHVLKEKPKRDLCIVDVHSVLLCAASSSSGLLWTTLGCFGLLCVAQGAVLRCFGRLWDAMGCSGLLKKGCFVLL